MLCNICNKEYKQIGQHLKKKHPEIDLEQWYIDNVLESIVPICLCCGNPAKFHNTSKGFYDYCSNECAKILMIDKSNKTKIERYGSLELATRSRLNKTKQTNLERYGVENVFASEKVKLKLAKPKKESPHVSWKDKTDLEMKAIQEKRKATCLDKYGVDHISKVPEIQNKITKSMMKTHKETLLRKYNVSNMVDIPGVTEKIHNSKKKNGTYKKSKKEESLFEILNKEYTVERQYKSNDYPFSCDFYLKEIDVYLELQGFISHRLDNIGYYYNSKEQQELVLNKLETGKQSYKNFIKVWTETDPLKRKISNKNNVKLVEILEVESYKDMIRRELTGLAINVSIDKCKKRLEYLNSLSGDITSKKYFSDIIYNYQSSFFKRENELYKDKEIRAKLISNRIKYLNKKEYELTDKDLLTGFKKSGLHYGFSHFSPLWLKYVIDKYEPKIVLDIFGGWGHRALLANTVETYIYNDISTIAYNGVLNMKDDLDLNIKMYNEDASTLKIDNYDLIVISPPYDNLEKYENEVADFNSLISNVISNIKENSIVSVFIDSKYLNLFSSLGSPIEEIEYNKSKSHFGKNNKEILAIFKV